MSIFLNVLMSEGIIWSNSLKFYGEFNFKAKKSPPISSNAIKSFGYMKN
jgi:hypothetical protein